MTKLKEVLLMMLNNNERINSRKEEFLVELQKESDKN